MTEKRYEHIQYADLLNDGSLKEVVVMKYIPETNDLYFIPVEYLDEIDIVRLEKIVKRKDADRYELWDLLSTVTLKNGVNALEYFNQFVQHRSANGKIQPPGRVISAKPRVIQRPPTADSEKRAGRPPKTS